ncbi:rhomboid family intramembrane serine protease [uncultured Brevundimonas sp.]|uniref:rhomboid family intramembrane serine protease n=1 Tax=uncultured Brevundimonas sp. TaxID=213418 RepID=UPI002612214E|nr:rhomboid family intramembrane serine protease [uncultured Brevundimonas sp.]
MSEETAAVGTTLQRASDGQLGLGADLSKPATWKALGREHGAPGLALFGLLLVTFVVELTQGGPDVWGLSGQALRDGRWTTLVSHIFAHAGLAHLLMNTSALLALSPIVLIRLGAGPASWLRYATLFLFAGWAGAALYLALHPFGAVPMVGASGAICGLWGAAARVDFDGGIVPLRSRQVWKNVKAFAKTNVILFLVLFAIVRVSGGVGGLAWEAHLGGFLFGLFAMPLLSGMRPERPDAESPDEG